MNIIPCPLHNGTIEGNPGSKATMPIPGLANARAALRTNSSWVGVQSVDCNGVDLQSEISRLLVGDHHADNLDVSS